jgi:hypothetical protein
MSDRFRSVTEYPQRQDANGVLMRWIDGLGYRFYWATEGLTPEDYAFSPGHGCATIGDLVGHVWGLANWVHIAVLGEGLGEPRGDDPQAQRAQVCRMLYTIRTSISAINQESLFDLRIEGHPFWHVVNGPLSDALTHVGQIASFRRLNGNPVPRHNVFSASAPER